MILSDEQLMAYADGELDADTRKQVEEGMAKDPEIARRVASHQALRDTLRSSFDQILEEPVPDRLTAAVRTGGRSSIGKRTAAQRRPAQSWQQWAALAASFVLGALAVEVTTSLHSSRPITERDGRLLASGALDRALSHQLASNQSSSDPVQIRLSFRSKDGSLCRAFQLRQTEALDGLACRDNNRWQIAVISRQSGSLGEQSEYRPAASVLPRAVLDAIDERIVGSPLDAGAEAQALR